MNKTERNRINKAASRQAIKDQGMIYDFGPRRAKIISNITEGKLIKSDLSEWNITRSDVPCSDDQIHPIVLERFHRMRPQVIEPPEVVEVPPPIVEHLPTRKITHPFLRPIPHRRQLPPPVEQIVRPPNKPLPKPLLPARRYLEPSLPEVTKQLPPQPQRKVVIVPPRDQLSDADLSSYSFDSHEIPTHKFKPLKRGDRMGKDPIVICQVCHKEQSHKNFRNHLRTHGL